MKLSERQDWPSVFYILIKKIIHRLNDINKEPKMRKSYLAIAIGIALLTASFAWAEDTLTVISADSEKLTVGAVEVLREITQPAKTERLNLNMIDYFISEQQIIIDAAQAKINEWLVLRARLVVVTKDVILLKAVEIKK